MKKSTFLYLLTVMFCIIFIVFSYKGYDKMIIYHNKIINGIHATGYFVIAGTFLIVAVISLVGGLIISDKTNYTISENNADKLNNNELPPL